MQRAGQIIFIGYFIAGGPLGAGATFGGMVATHPVRGYALSLSQSAVYAQIDSIRYLAPGRQQSDERQQRHARMGRRLRLRPLAFGSATHVMLFDADKNHHFHSTQYYSVQVGWYDRVWKTCWQWGFIPYPCYDDVWRTAQTGVYPQFRAINLPMSSLYGLAKPAQQLVCAAGVNEINNNGSTIRLCDQNLDTMANNFLPTLNFPVPYQDVEVPASQWFTTYWWRFSTWNGGAGSGYTGWSSFYRSF